MHRAGRTSGLRTELRGDETQREILQLLELGKISVADAERALQRNRELSQHASRT